MGHLRGLCLVLSVLVISTFGSSSLRPKFLVRDRDIISIIPVVIKTPIRLIARSAICPKNEVFYQCLPKCPITCGNLINPVCAEPPKYCVSGCDCPWGYARTSSQSECIEMDHCQKKLFQRTRVIPKQRATKIQRRTEDPVIVDGPCKFPSLRINGNCLIPECPGNETMWRSGACENVCSEDWALDCVPIARRRNQRCLCGKSEMRMNGECVNSELCKLPKNISTLKKISFSDCEYLNPEDSILSPDVVEIEDCSEDSCSLKSGKEVRVKMIAEEEFSSRNLSLGLCSITFEEGCHWFPTNVTSISEGFSTIESTIAPMFEKTNEKHKIMARLEDDRESKVLMCFLFDAEIL